MWLMCHGAGSGNDGDDDDGRGHSAGVALM